MLHRHAAMARMVHRHVIHLAHVVIGVLVGRFLGIDVLGMVLRGRRLLGRCLRHFVAFMGGMVRLLRHRRRSKDDRRSDQGWFHHGEFAF
jgi:hypothetical protein